MQIFLQQLLPAYFEKNAHKGSEVWDRELIFTKGNYVKIVAPSGRGKTSLMHFMYGMRNEYRGNILYDQHDIKNFTVEDFARYRKDHISMVFQDLRLFPEQTVWENIEIKRQLNPYHPSEKITMMAERLGLGEKLSSACKTCSYGEQQRVAIIRSLMQPFEFLLLDEPFSHLDNNNSQRAMELMIEETKARNAAIIFADLERIDYFPYTALYHL